MKKSFIPIRMIFLLFDFFYNLIHYLIKNVICRILFFLFPLNSHKIVIRAQNNKQLKEALFLIKFLLKQELKIVCVLSRKGKYDFFPDNITAVFKKSISSLFHIYTAKTILYYGMPKKISIRKSFQRNILILTDSDIDEFQNVKISVLKKIDVCLCNTQDQHRFAKQIFLNTPVLLREEKNKTCKVVKTITIATNNQFLFFLQKRLSDEQFIKHYISIDIQSLLYILDNGSLFNILYLRFFKKFDIFLFNMVKIFISRFSFLFPVDKNKIVFYNNFNQFSCNIKYIINELMHQDKKYKIVYIISNNKSSIHNLDNIKIVKSASVKSIYELATSKLWVYNSIKPPFIPVKKQNQIFIQTWHGSLGIKRVEPEYIYDQKWLEKALKNNEITDYCISNSIFETLMYQNSYWKNATVLEYGHARNDILFHANIELVKNIRAKFNVSDNFCICLYAPTYREDYDCSMYLTDFTSIIDALEKRFGRKFVIFVRFHHWFLRHAKFSMNKFSFSNNVINVSDHEDMQELLASIDVGISDYSSWVFDFMLTRKPIFLYASDAEDYQMQRSFYYKLTDTPFPVSSSINSLVESIVNFDEPNYKDNVELFLQDKGCIDDGCAAIRVVNKINQLLHKEQK